MQIACIPRFILTACYTIKREKPELEMVNAAVLAPSQA